MLYKRNYFVLTEREKSKGIKVKEWFSRVKTKQHGGVSTKQLFKYWRELPLAVQFNDTLFPNNYLPPNQYENTQKITQQIETFENLLNSIHTERDILNFFKHDEAYCFIYELFNEFSTGNHGAFAFREFPLSTNYVADYLLLGKNSGGYEFIFVEFENSKGDITTSSGDFGTTIRKGLRQIEDWSTWLDAYFSSLKPIFEKYRNPIELLTNEFYELDKSRIHFIVIAGRRSDYKDKTYRLRRKYKRSQDTSIIHYDNLVDTVRSRLNEEIKRIISREQSSKGDQST